MLVPRLSQVPVGFSQVLGEPEVSTLSAMRAAPRPELGGWQEQVTSLLL
jgi:hypothetical protein